VPLGLVVLLMHCHASAAPPPGTWRLARVDTRTETHGLALDDIETYVTQTAQLTHPAPEPTTPANDTQGQDVKTGPGVDMTTTSRSPTSSSRWLI
jgi:hypothetical protein